MLLIQVLLYLNYVANHAHVWSQKAILCGVVVSKATHTSPRGKSGFDSHSRASNFNFCFAIGLPVKLVGNSSRTKTSNVNVKTPCKCTVHDHSEHLCKVEMFLIFSYMLIAYN